MIKWVGIFVFFIGLINSFQTVSAFSAHTDYNGAAIALPFICLNDSADTDNSDDKQSDESLPDAEDYYTINRNLSLHFTQSTATASGHHKSIDAFDSEANTTTPPPKH